MRILRLTPWALALTLAAGLIAPALAQSYPHEPAGFVKITELGFNQSGEAGWQRSGGYRADSTSPWSPGSVLRFTKAARSSATSFSPGAFDAPRFAVRDLYVFGAFRLDPKYSANPSNVNKLGIFIGVNRGAQVFFNGFGGGKGFAAPLQAQVNVQGAVPSLGGNSPSRDGHFGSRGVLTRGRWYYVALRFRLNTYGKADGLLEGWLIDAETGAEVQFLNKSNAALIGPGTIPTTSASSMIDVLRMNAIHGGGVATLPAPTWIEWDHLYASGR